MAVLGVRSPKVIWAPYAQMYSLAETTQPPPNPAIGLIYEEGYLSAKIDDISLWPPDDSGRER
jgi:hypothetical protein